MALLIGCGDGGAAQQQAVQAAYAEYAEAFKRGDLGAVKGRLSAARAKELDDPEAAAKMPLAAALRPAAPRMTSCTVEASRATLAFEAPAEGGTAKGKVVLLREGGLWRVDQENWSIEFPPPPPPPEPPRPMPASVRAIVDRIASADAAAGAAAHTELAAKYQDAKSYLRDVREGLEDARPIAFVMVPESFSGGGHTFAYFSPKPAESGKREPAKTVGEALRYPLWQYEGVGEGGFKTTFAAWWKSYAAARGLPGGD
jgi:hypothetical protein